ncbi:SCO family protein [Haliangium ochraceum]|uniref:Electron transport protein SCO1/SenC n=1 Tax=Haliangium ochraceum (strain DSM 14365 / JCM 11303 / SMP-2) TaxID=502025 RepID=D0LJV8_HALO1|nr:SCO family protein [Haliangium ochraceum]ACY18465.1 electron transport protein SCO1/SenC [Haliangium ochraceum DSM 14365]
MSDAHTREPGASASPDNASPGRRLRGPLAVLAVFGIMGLMFVGAVVLPTVAMETEPALEVYGEMPAFRLRDQTGAVLSSEELRGHVVIASFLFTRCPTICPLIAMKMRRIQDRTSDAGAQIKLLSISVDPEHDTPEILADYADSYGADPQRWRFLTGEPDEVKRISEQGFMLGLQRQGELAGGIPDIVHSERLVLIDPALRIRGYYDASDAVRLERMLRDARRLIAESQGDAPESGDDAR